MRTMVSLGDDSRRSGGFFFDRNESGQDSEELLAEDRLSGHSEPSFKPLSTTWLIALMMLLTICLELMAFLVPDLTSLPCVNDNGQNGTSASAVIVYCQAALWVLCLLCDRYWRYKHYVSRIAGYLEFYRQSRSIRRIPVLVVSGGSVMMLVITTVLSDYCAKDCGGDSLTVCNYQQILVSVQTLILLPVLVIYLVKTCRFNKQRAPPDVCQEDFIVSLFQPQPIVTDIGYRDDSYVDEVLEKQADMIRYLKQHNVNLARRVIQLSAQVREKDLHV